MESGNTVSISVSNVTCLVCGLFIVVAVLSVAIAASLGALNSRIPSHSDAVFERRNWGLWNL